MSSSCNLAEECVCLCEFLKSDWCEAVLLHIGLVDVFEGSLLSADSAVTWVAPHWLISLVIAWLQPQVWLALSERPSIKNLYRPSTDHRALQPVPCSQWDLTLIWGGFIFSSVCPCCGRQLNTAHIPIKPLCPIKFIAIIQSMAEIAELTAPVPVNQNSDEREVWRCHQHNKRAFGPQPLLFEKPAAPGQGKG